MKTAFAIAALAAVFTTGAYAQDGADRSLAGIPVEQYHYGMNLDVQRIISKTDISDKTGVVPVTMVYQDSHGQVHKLQYLENGGFDIDANG
ncbi:DUF2790 domain-containing protein [Pseudomonas typographi]|uniref:DUF2790 domain-containing protein n=1 Tax=Pseudomonas typographi TaxID=2715964 RepID=A0ABR7Z8Z5_9PSED|nr:DUF2790 domain-containing protein [Pseudomonas typographi]MBD1554861.1 DUF2790 domain-containing protein [Pseudomonas typographi]MBD1589902.1 DUF2790 domain-containing protein [Pseudomonas typographi]MBD1601907.1 DUF2790 domain-containing protein [Pseudomonas typographi]